MADGAHEIGPQKGFQTQFLSTPADIAIGGSGAGVGKTYALLMEMLRNHHLKDFSAVTFRRTYPQIKAPGGLWDTSMSIFSNVKGAKPSESSYEWRFSSGAKIKFSHLEYEKNVLDWQGSQIPLICCKVGTLIQTKKGFVKIEDLNVGDEIKTLKGYSNLVKKGLPNFKRGISIKLHNGETQDVSTNHEILTNYGWISYDHTIEFFQRNLFRLFHKIASPSGQKLPFSLLYLLARIYLKQQGEEPQISNHNQYIEQEIFSYILKQVQESDFEAFDYDNLNALRRTLSSRNALKLLSLCRDQEVEVGNTHDPIQRVFDDAHSLKLFVDFLFDYHLLNHLYGVCAQFSQDIVSNGSPLLAYVDEHCHYQQQTNGQDNILQYIPCGFEFSHPYNGSKQIAEVGCVLSTFEWTCVDYFNVIDLTIDKDNHYISRSGLINKNCFDELTHFSEKMFFYLLSRNRSTCGVRPYVRATCNPDPDSWVAKFIEWWIDQDTGFPIPEREGKMRYFVKDSEEYVWGSSKLEVLEKIPHMIKPLMEADPTINVHDLVKSVSFITGSIYENVELMRKDPGYLGNLMAQDEATKAQLLDGNWKVRIEGADLINYTKMQDAFTNTFVPRGLKCMTADIALEGSDLFVIGVWDGYRLIDLYYMEKSKGNDVINLLREVARKYGIPQSRIVYDDDGVGAFVDGFIKGARSFNGGTKARKGQNYTNLKSQCFFKLAERINKDELYIAPNVAEMKIKGKTIQHLMMDERRAIKKHKPDNDGKLSVIPKEQQKNIIGHSPDLMDMLNMRQYFEFITVGGDNMPMDKGSLGLY